MVVEEDDEEVGTAEDEASMKSSNEEVQQGIETLLIYSFFTKNWEIGAMATKISSVVQSELIRFSTQMTKKNVQEKLAI